LVGESDDEVCGSVAFGGGDGYGQRGGLPFGPTGIVTAFDI
jgi:hypothetical protein